MKKEIEIEVSARHIHLSKDDYNFLFGAETPFKEIKELSQRKEFATDKIVTIVGPKGEIPARFLSPFRQETQTEFSLTDCYQIGVIAPYETEIIDGCADIILKTSNGEIHRCAMMIAKRHLHASPTDAAELKIKENQKVEIAVETPRGKIVFDDVNVKIDKNFQLRVHLDTDEGNAAGITDKCFGSLILDENDINN
ncbi:MAG: PduL/EutD family phosphate acyltransferase [Candidatus Berkelbacteria bacterium]|nr:PduL/EutD family phosphate acyltransferase [Candidatus Berkelbacteria bacterium]